MEKKTIQNLQEDNGTRKWGNYHNKVAPNQDNEFVSDFIGIERQNGERSIMLDIQFQNGKQKAIPYTYLSGMEYDPSEGITLEFMEKKITILGRNLDKLYEYLLLHRVNYLKENVGDLDDTPENQLFIEEIKLDNTVQL